MPLITKEVHPLAMKHILGELKRRNAVSVDHFGSPVPTVKKLNRRGEGTQVFSISEQPLTHIIPESSWLTGPGFETLVYPVALEALMAEVTEATSASVQDEIMELIRSGAPFSW